MFWTSSERLMYVQFTSCVYGDVNKIGKRLFVPNLQYCQFEQDGLEKQNLFQEK